MFELIAKLINTTDELADATLAEFRSERGYNEGIEAIFEIAKIMRKEKAAAGACD